MVDGAAPRIRSARSTSGVGYAPQEEQHDRSDPTSHGVPGPLCTCDLVTWGPRAPLHVRPRHMGSQGPSARATSSHGVPGPLCTCDLVTWGPRAPLHVRPRHMGSQGPSASATSSHGVPGPLCTCDLVTWGPRAPLHVRPLGGSGGGCRGPCGRPNPPGPARPLSSQKFRHSPP